MKKNNQSIEITMKQLRDILSQNPDRAITITITQESDTTAPPNEDTLYPNNGIQNRIRYGEHLPSHLRLDGKPIERLTKYENYLLESLLLNVGVVKDVYDIYAYIMEKDGRKIDDDADEVQAIRKHISNLRQKLGEDGDQIIICENDLGYIVHRFEAKRLTW